MFIIQIYMLTDWLCISSHREDENVYIFCNYLCSLIVKLHRDALDTVVVVVHIKVIIIAQSKLEMKEYI